MHSFCSVRLIQVSNNRNDHQSQVKGVRVGLIEVSVEYRYFLQWMWEKENGTCTAVRLIEGVRLIWGQVWPYSEDVTRCGTRRLQRAWQLFSGESSFYNMFWDFASKKSSAVFRKQACISLLQSAEARRPLLTKRWKESQALPSLLFVLSWCFWVTKQWEQQH